MASNTLTAASPASTYGQLLHLGTGTASVAVIRDGFGTATAISFVTGGFKVTGTHEVTGAMTVGGTLSMGSANKTTLVSSATVARTITFPDESGVVMLQGSPVTLPRTAISLAARKTQTAVLAGAGVIQEMNFTPQPNSIYAFEAYFIYKSTATTCGISIRLNFGGYPVYAGAGAVASPASNSVYVGADARTGGSEWLVLIETVGVPIANTQYFVRASGFYKTNSSAQSPVKVAFNPEVDGTEVSLEIGSMIIHDKIS